MAKKKHIMFSRIENREDALKMVRDVSYGFFFVAVLQTLVGLLFLHDFSVLVDAAIYVVGGLFLLRFKSRAAAVAILLMALLAAGVTGANIGSSRPYGGTNIILALIILWAAIRAVEATFKLHGRFTEDAEGKVS
ncbi:MAG: hypothetical protein SFW62_01405 [Alphaproteobacteria bacterium]|nr:hypothetical protein [Alphaproteobacteria bacterium]